jgi:hypothetical protein
LDIDKLLILHRVNPLLDQLVVDSADFARKIIRVPKIEIINPYYFGKIL